MTHIQKTDLFFWITLILIVICGPIGVCVGLYMVMGPETFWQRVVMIVVSASAGIMALVPFGFLMYFLNEWYNNHLVKKRKRAEKEQRDLERRCREAIR